MTWLVVAVLAVVVVPPLHFAVRAGLTGRRGGLRDRLDAVDGLAGSAACTALALPLVPWDAVPPLLWGLPVAATAFGALASARAWRGLPSAAGAHPRRRLVTSAVGAVVALAVVGAILLA